MALLDSMRASAQAEEDFFAEIRRNSHLSTRAFIRPSRSGGPQHVIIIDRRTLAPVDEHHPCSCAAGVEGRYCWAVLSVLSEELPKISQEPEVLDVARCAKAVLDEREKKSVRKGHK